jgi:hypothetical protein
MSKTNKKSEEKPKVHDELSGYEVSIDPFGEIQSSLSIEKLNDFLNKNVVDKKLVDRDDLDNIKRNEDETSE